jgi:hypothetical protein
MSDMIKLEHPDTGKVKELKKGWSWTCFFFYFSGIPLFNRGLYVHGAIMITLWLSMFVADYWVAYEDCSIEPCLSILFGDLVALIMLPPWIFYSIKANKMGLAALQSQGWVIKQDPVL